MTRPRRSTAANAPSYTLQPLVLSDEDENDPNLQLQLQAGLEADSDESEYGKDSDDDPRSRDKGKGKAKIKQEDESDSSEEDEEEEEEEEDSGSNGAPGDGEDDDSDEDIATDDGRSDASTSGRKKKKKQPVKAKIRISSTAKPKKQAAPTIVIAGGLAAVPKPIQTVSTRAKGEGDVDERAFLDYSPLYEPPMRILDDFGQDALTITTGPPLSWAARAHFAQMWTVTAFSPDITLAQDLGWWKGKWDVDGMKREWGGWYDEIKSKKIITVTAAALDEYKPELVYYSKKVPPHIVLPLPDEDDEVEGEAEPVKPPMEVEEEDDEDEEDPIVKLWIGPLDSNEEQQLITIDQWTSRPLDEFYPTKPGHIFNAGAPISGMSWCPQEDSTTNPTEYLALSTISYPISLRHSPSPRSAMLQIWSLDTSVESDLSSTTGDESGAGLVFQLGLCISVGEAIDIQWCPKGRSNAENDEMDTTTQDPRLGILAGAFSDGSISLFMVPKPESLPRRTKSKPSFIKLEPILTLMLQDTSCLSFAWMSHETIVGGCMNGSVAVWYVGDALRKGLATVRPIQYFPVALAAIRSVAVIRAPPFSAQLDDFDHDAEPTSILASAYDGTTRLIEVRDATSSTVVAHERTAATVAGFSAATGCGLTNDGENRLVSIILRPREFTSGRKILIQRGTIWSIATSDHHPFVASTSADGSCTIANALRSAKKRSHTAHFAQKIYRLDFNRITGEFRMVDNVKPEQRLIVEPPKKGKKRSIAFEEAVSDAAWSPEIGISRAVWHPHLRYSSLLASGMACGLGRIDWTDRENTSTKDANLFRAVLRKAEQEARDDED